MAWSAVAPVLVLIGGALLLLAVDALSRRPPGGGVYALYTVVTAGIAVGAAIPLWQRVQDADRGPFSTLAQSIGVDGFSVFATITICAAVILAALLFDGWLRREGMEGAEPYVLLLLSASGGVMMASANDLIVMFLGLEILSIAVYVLAAMHLRKITSQEAGVKYFVLGAFSSAFFLYGIALTYGATGSTNLVEIAGFLSTTVLANSGLVLAGMALLLVGFAFKVAAVPFHFWTPDVYQGAPTPSVAWMASGVKVAGFAGLLRVFYLAFGTYSVDWQPIIYVLAAVTMIVGSVLAVVQTDVKRMLAYSSINHAGFILVAVQAASAARGRGGPLLPGRLHVHGGRQLRRHRRRQPQGRHRQQPRRLPGAVPGPPDPRPHVRAAPVRPGRRAPDVGVLRQVLRDHRRRRGRVHRGWPSSPCSPRSSPPSSTCGSSCRCTCRWRRPASPARSRCPLPLGWPWPSPSPSLSASASSRASSHGPPPTPRRCSSSSLPTWTPPPRPPSPR